MKSSSIQRFSMRCLSTPLMNAMSPPVWTVKNSSAKRVPNSALPGTEGTQYRSSPGSRIGFTTAPLVHCVFAYYRYMVDTGWLFGTSDQKKTIRSLQIQSEYEQVADATP